MTGDMMNLRSLLEMTPDANLLREMIGSAAERLTELEVGALAGAAHGEKSPLRLAQRNSYHDRDWETRAGTVELGILKLRKTEAAPGGGADLSDLVFFRSGVQSLPGGKKLNPA